MTGGGGVDGRGGILRSHSEGVVGKGIEKGVGKRNLLGKGQRSDGVVRELERSE